MKHDPNCIICCAECSSSDRGELLMALINLQIDEGWTAEQVKNMCCRRHQSWMDDSRKLVAAGTSKKGN